MEKEKKSIKILRIVFGALLLVGIGVSIFLYWFLDAKVVDWGWDSDDYNAATNTTECYVLVEFNVNVEDVQIKVQFFDKNDEKIAEMTKNCVLLDEKTAGAYFTVTGNPDSCLLVDGSYSYEPNMYGFYIALIVDVMLVALFVQALMCKCKTFYYQDKEIVVYAGLMHRHVKVNGVEVCRRSNAFTYGTANLACMLDDGSQLCAYIGRSNKIMVMVNNQYLPEVKNPAAAPAGYQYDSTANGGNDNFNN